MQHKLVLIDGSHIFVKTFLLTYKELLFKEKSHFNKTLSFLGFLSNFYANQYLEIYMQFSKSDNIDEKINSFLDDIMDKDTKSKFLQAFQLFDRRIMMSLNYAPQLKLEQDILLFRAANAINNSIDELGSYLGLDSIVQRKEQLKVVQLDGDHMSIVDDETLIDKLVESITRSC